MTPEPRSPGSAFYDDPDTFRAYTARHTSNPRNPNHVMEGPAVRAALGDVTGADVLDLGCGDARFGVELLERGAASYLGVDGSRRMTRLAATTLADRPHAHVEHAQLETYTPTASSADIVTSRLAAHYLADLDSWLTTVRAALRPGGRLVITVVHPVLSCHHTPSERPREQWIVDDYFSSGPRRRPWYGGEVVWHHRTVEQYHQAVVTAGFTVRTLRGR